MDGVFASLALCMAVLLISLVASVAASYLVVRSMKRRTGATTALTTQPRPMIVQGAPTLDGAGRPTGDAMLTFDESIEVRGLLMRTVAPRPEELVVWAHRKWPNATRDQLAGKLISSTAGKCGFIGFVTGAPGLFALPVTLPVDIVATGRLQAVMVQALAYLYEIDDDPDDAQRRGLMIMVGGGSLARSITQLSIKIIGPSMMKAVPVLGALAGYAANYALAQVAGRAAMTNFRRSLTDTASRAATQPTIHLTAGAAPVLTGDAEPVVHVIPANAPALAAPRVEQAAPLAAHPPDAAATAATGRFCTACGHQHAAPFRFCTVCGAAAQS